MRTAFGHHSIRISDNPCLGNSNRERAVRPSICIHCGELKSCNCPADCKCLYWSAVGACGDPNSFHDVKALLCAESMRKCSTNPLRTSIGKPLMVSSTEGAAAGTSFPC